MREAVGRFREEKCDLAVELGDLVDAAEAEAEELRYLRTIEAEYATFGGERHHVLGNHCVWTLTKKVFLETVGQSASHFAVDRGGFHLVVLDGCFRKDGVAYGARNFAWNDSEIPEAQRDWLAESLEATSLPAVVFVHQRLDVTGDYAVRSAPAVREILERAGKVLAVFQGHYHENDYREIRGIHYVTLAALVEGAGAEHNAYGILDIHADGSMRLRGFRRQASRETAARARARAARV
jgi:alkaline phosphatase